MENYNKVKESKKTIFLNNTIGGIGWAVGATIGLALIVLILGIIVKHVNLVPVVGNFVSSVLQEVLQKNPQLIK